MCFKTSQIKYVTIVPQLSSEWFIIMTDGKDYDDKVYLSDNLHSVELIMMNIWINELHISPKIAYLVIFSHIKL